MSNKNTDQPANANDKALTAFDEIKALLEGVSEEDFWQRFAPLSAQLLRSPFSHCFRIDGREGDGATQLLASYSSGDSDNRRHNTAYRSDPPESFASQSLSLAARMPEKGFIFEPLNTGLTDIREPFVLCFELQSQENGRYFTACIIEHNPVAAFNDLVVRSQLIQHLYLCSQRSLGAETPQAPVLDSMYSKVNSESKDVAPKTEDMRDTEDLLYTLEILDLVSQKPNFQLSCMTLVDELAYKFDCTEVCIGQLQGDYLKMQAVSHVESFDKNSDAINEIEYLFEEAVDQQAIVQVPLAAHHSYIAANHEKYCRTNALDQLVSIPFRGKGDEQFCLTLKKKKGRLSAHQIQAIDVLLHQLAPWLAHSALRDAPLVKRLAQKIRGFGQWWLGANNTLTKLLAVAFTGLLLASIVIQVDYRIEAVATLETDNLAYLSAPFNGFVQQVVLQPGDVAKKGQLLAQIDTEELELKALEERANIARFVREAEKARSVRKLVDMKVSLARKAQSEAELSRIQYYIEHAALRSPFDGIVVEGEKEELLGAPVSKGDLLIKVANPIGLYARIKLPERDIDDVVLKADAELKLLSRPEQTFNFSVSRIVPLASVDSADGNVFIVKARIDGDVPHWWRPGMNGVMHVNGGKRSLLWIALHRTLDTLRMKFWI